MTSSALMRARALPPSFQLHISTPVPTDGGKTLAFVLFVATQPRPMPHEFLRANVRCPFPPASGGERKAGARPGFPAGWRVICPQKRDIGVAQLPLGPAGRPEVPRAAGSLGPDLWPFCIC